MKSVLREPRPLFIDGDIKVNDCKHMEFGNPSSHTYGSAVMYLTTVYLIIKHYWVDIQKYQLIRSYNKTITIAGNEYKFNVLLILAHFIAFAIVNAAIYTIGISRLFKGVHTYNQILNGAILGTILSAIICFILYKNLFKFYLSIKKRSAW